MPNELHDLALDFAQAAAGAVAAVTPVMEVGGRKMQATARQAAPLGPHTPHYPRSITYDVEVEASSVTVEMGPDKDLPQGPLGNIFEYGTARQGPQPHVGPAADAEVPNIERHAADQIVDLL